MFRLYIALGIVAALIVSHGAAYYKGYSNSSQRARIEVLERSLKAVQEAYDQEQAARKADAVQAKVDREEQALQDLATQELIDALTDRARVCFDAGDADRLRDAINR